LPIGQRYRNCSLSRNILSRQKWRLFNIKQG
jgi:hypothetical protein